MVKLVDLNYLLISSSISVGKGKLIPNEKKKEKVYLRMTKLIRGYVNHLA